MKPPQLSKILLLAASVVLLFVPLESFGVESDGRVRAFETIGVELDVFGGTALDSFEDYWPPSAGGRLEFATPFYAGSIRAGGHLFDNEAASPEVPSFLGVWSYLGWSYEWLLPARLAWSAGIQTGVMFMDFDEENTPEARRDETELGFAVDTRVRYGVADPWSIVLAGEYRVILTDREIEYVFGGVGLLRTFATPMWLREFLE